GTGDVEPGEEGFGHFFHQETITPPSSQSKSPTELSPGHSDDVDEPAEGPKVARVAGDNGQAGGQSSGGDEQVDCPGPSCLAAGGQRRGVDPPVGPGG